MFILALQFATKFLEGQNYALMTSQGAPDQATWCQAQSRCSKTPHGYLDIGTTTTGIKDGPPSQQTGNLAKEALESFIFLCCAHAIHL